MVKPFQTLLTVFCLLVVLLGGIPTSHVRAATVWTVTSAADGNPAVPANCPHATNCRLRDAIAAAAAGDTIIFSPALSGGTIQPATSTFTLSKDVTINGSALASKITIDGDTDGNGVGNRRLFIINAGVTVTFDSIIFKSGAGNAFGTGGGGAIWDKGGTVNINNSSFVNNSADGKGGGIYSEGTLTITDSSFTGNYADDGGAICTIGAATITNSTFSENLAILGGGLYNEGTLSIVGTNISKNSADSYGGGLYNSQGTLNITDSSIANNSAHGGGGVETEGAGSSVTISNSTFTENSASFTGGGIENNGGTIAEPGMLTIYNSTFLNNSAELGGGIKTSDKATITGSTFESNTATSSGGGIYNVGSYSNLLTLVNNTFYNNSAKYSGGGVDGGITTIINNSFSNNSAETASSIDVGEAVFINNIVANSVSGDECYISVITSNINNLVEDGTCSPAMTGDPKLGPLADNGVPTKTMALLTGSPAIDAGNDAACSSSPVNGLDQRGVARPQGTHCDLGAFEVRYLFMDVPESYWAVSFIERLYTAGITGGCGTAPLIYCPESPVTRAQMAVFLLRGIHSSSYSPPNALGTVFADVPLGYWADKWIEQLSSEGITSGCGANIYCPDSPVTRAQMAVFLLKSKYGSSYSPPDIGNGTGFTDVPADYWAAKWIKQLAAEAITSGCSSGVYCPEGTVTRAQMAVFLVKAFGLP